MLRLPSGQKTNNEKKYEKEWTKVANILAKEIGLKVRSVWGSITFENRIMRSNGKSATNKTISLPHWIVIRLASTVGNLKSEVKWLKDMIEACGDEVEDEADEAEGEIMELLKDAKASVK
jgi:hypothetical protein